MPVRRSARRAVARRATLISATAIQVTIDSLDAARAALANGVNEGSLSPNGCVTYRRELDSAGQVTSQAILHAGATVMVWNHTPTQSTAARDIDLNGCPDWRSTA